MEVAVDVSIRARGTARQKPPDGAGTPPLALTTLEWGKHVNESNLAEKVRVLPTSNTTESRGNARNGRPTSSRLIDTNDGAHPHYLDNYHKRT